MSQYAWRPVFKFVPTDGTEDVLDMTEVFTDTGRPNTIDPSHDPEMTPKVDVNRKGNAKGWGFRPACSMTIEIFSTELEAFLALIVNRLLANDVWTSYLSLDGGLNYHQVELKKFDGPNAIKGKTFAGASYTLGVVATDLLDLKPALGTGTW